METAKSLVMPFLHYVTTVSMKLVEFTPLAIVCTNFFVFEIDGCFLNLIISSYRSRHCYSVM